MPGRMPKAYEGERPYIFVNYAHADSDVVLPIVRALVDEGYRVWWDVGIEPTTDYDEYLADHVYGCDCLVMFISRASLASDWCTQEVRYALDLKKKVLPVYLEDVELIRGLQMRMGGRQALLRYAFDSDEEFYRRLFKARRLESCLTEEGRLRRGVKPRSAAAEAGRATASQPASARTVIRTELSDKPNAEPTTVTGTGTGAEKANERHRGTTAVANDGRVLLNAFPALRSLVTDSQCVDVPGVEQREAFNNYSLVELKERFKVMPQQR